MRELFELSKTLASKPNASDAGDVFLRHIRRLIPYSSAVLYIYDIQTEQLVSAFVSGDHAGLLRNMRIPVGQRIAGWVAAHQKPIRNSDPVLDLGETARAIHPRPQSALTVPVIDSSQLIGTISLYSTIRDGFNEGHQRIAEVMAPHIAPVLQKAREEMFGSESCGGADTLPDLRGVNRWRRLISVGPNTALSVVHVSSPTLVALRVANQESAAEQVLARVVALVSEVVRRTDLTFRLGDDEYVVLSDDATHAEGLTRTIRRRLASDEQLQALCQDFDVTLASAPGDGSSLNDLIHAAQAKRATVRRASNNGPEEAIH
jgi:putative methionine-R-sulfoxide reductase with GAF domain